jgi:hypothetical protein
MMARARGGLGRLAGALAVSALAVTACASAPGAPGAPSAYLGQIWRYFRVWYQRVAEDKPPGTDWLTGKPLSYDVDHEDTLVYLDARGRERFVVDGNPNARTAPIAPALRRFLSTQGRADLGHPTRTPGRRPKPSARSPG